MKRYWILSSCCLLSVLQAQEDTFSEKRMDTFYDEFVCEEKSILENFDLSTSCTPTPPSPTPTPTPTPTPPPSPTGTNPLPPNCPAATTPPLPSLPAGLPGQMFNYPSTFDPPSPTGFYMYNSPPSGTPQPTPWAPTALLPVLITNNTGYNGDVYIVVFGQVPACPATPNERYVFIQYNSDGTVNQAIPVTSDASGPFPTAADYSYKLSSFSTTVGNMTQIYLPPLDGGRIYISLGAPLVVDVSANSIGEPSPMFDTSLPSYNTVFDKVEFTFLPSPCNNIQNLPRGQFAFNTTAVDFFGLPIYLYMTNPNQKISGNPAPVSATAGIHQNRACVLYNLQATFEQLKDGNQLDQWESLFQYATSPPPPGIPSVVRVMSSSDAVADHLGQQAPPFDPNYLDDAASYGYSWANDVWTGTSAFYTSPVNALKCITLTNQVGYQGFVQNGVFTFKMVSNPNGVPVNNYYFIPWQNYPSGQLMQSSTQGFVAALTTFPGMSFGSTPNYSQSTLVFTQENGPQDPNYLNAKELCQALQVGWVLNQIPGAKVLSQPTMQAVIAAGKAFAPNPNLHSSLPWYALYSQGIHQPTTGMVLNNFTYAYPWDDYMYNTGAVYKNPPFYSVAPQFSNYADGAYISIDLRPVN